MKKKILLGFIGLLLLIVMTLLVQAHHEGLPQGTHQMPNGQIMSDDAMKGAINNKESTIPIRALVVVGFILIFGVGIWLLARSTRRNPIGSK